MKTYRITQEKSNTRGIYVSYHNPDWINGIKDKHIYLDIPDHIKQFIELLEESGYKEEQSEEL